ncbi:hypothetical protein F5Y07DRAFT_394918 [Xylaria sp. FL0933]|nr:hypothetical protein F5Y07DRAFT_394918 [Xylaria sp. FL0933]
MHPEIFGTISNITNSWNDPPIDKVDHVPVWRHIFANAISKVRLKEPQYWVIDALDECKNGLELMTFVRYCLLSELRIFLTFSVPRLVHSKKYLTAFYRTLEATSYGVSLVLRELRQLYTAVEINQMLASNPLDMDALYARILDEMSYTKFGKDLAKAILTWPTCAFRPLFLDEMHCAIESDILDSLDDIEKSISTYSNLFFIAKAKKVQLVHLTARYFLTRKDTDSEFIIDRSVAHKTLALVCIRALCGGQENMRKGSEHRRLPGDTTSNTDSVLYDYASTYLF